MMDSGCREAHIPGYWGVLGLVLALSSLMLCLGLGLVLALAGLILWK